MSAGSGRIAGLVRRMIPRGTRGRPKHDEYDYVLIGAGSAGCVLANELSSDPSKPRVLLLEAGGWDWNPLIHIPAGVYSVFKEPGINWNMESEPAPSAAGRSIELPRGKVVGGSSAINAMVYMRGHPKDYDFWASEHDLPEWSFDRCLPYFKRCETSDRGASAFRGDRGRLSVTRGSMENPMYEAFIEAGKQSGQGTSEDLNGYRPEGVARLDRTASPEGRRCSAADAHLLPALSANSNLELVTHAEVTSISFEGRRATGVNIASSGNSDSITKVRAAREVILSAGAIKTPQLLMLSGVGDKDYLLREHGIACVAHLPGVGSNLQDHACVNVAFHASSGGRAHSLDYLAHPIHKAIAGVQWFASGKGPASSNIWEAGGLVRGQHGGFDPRSEGNIDAPNLQYHFCPVFSSYTGSKLSMLPGFQMQIDQLRPRSRGHVRLRSRDPFAAPASQFNYLSDDRDVKELVDGYKTALDLLSQPALSVFRGDIGLPNSPLKTNDDIEAFVRSTSGTDYHPCGTCRMGGNENDPEVVVDEQLRVRDLEGLRVVDASVMPQIVSGNLNAPTQMIALKAADMILGKPAMVPETPTMYSDSP